MPARQPVTGLISKKSASISVQSASVPPISTSSTPTSQQPSDIPIAGPISPGLNSIQSALVP